MIFQILLFLLSHFIKFKLNVLIPLIIPLYYFKIHSIESVLFCLIFQPLHKVFHELVMKISNIYFYLKFLAWKAFDLFMNQKLLQPFFKLCITFGLIFSLSCFSYVIVQSNLLLILIQNLIFTTNFYFLLKFKVEKYITFKVQFPSFTSFSYLLCLLHYTKTKICQLSFINYLI